MAAHIKADPKLVKDFIMQNVKAHPQDVVVIAAEHFGVATVTIHKTLRILIAQGLIAKSGKTKSTTYSVTTSLEKKFSIKVDGNLEEDELWRKHFLPLKNVFTDAVYDICYYGFTEMVNNVIDHSAGDFLVVKSDVKDGRFRMAIFDDGIGIFRKIKEAKGFSDEREAILQLSKGKLTTDPERHSGEGIFFSSRIFDFFSIYANGLYYGRDNEIDDWFFESKVMAKNVSTLVTMEIDLDSKRKFEDVYKQFGNPESGAFTKTHISVNLSLSGEDRFVSRSQAKRILMNLDKFEHVLLDFKGIKFVGQAFVDEAFRVFPERSPGVAIEYRNANEDVKFMIERGLATAKNR